jgi:integrase
MLNDVQFLEDGLGRLTVYEGDGEEYQTFVSPECVEAIKDYLASRERVGEVLGPDSLLFRDKFDYQGDRRQKKLSPSELHPTTEHNLRTTILRLWQRAGVRKANDGRPFKCDHGLRKFAKTQMSRAGMKWEDNEVLLGHAFSYNKPSMEHLQEEYLKAVPFLCVDEKYALKWELEREHRAHEDRWQKARLENLEQKQVISELLARQDWLERIADALAEIPEVAAKLREHAR